MENKAQATTVKKFFSRTTSILKYMDAQPDLIWDILTNAKEYTKWTSTITMFEGTIAKGHRIKLKSDLDDKRVFNVKVIECIPNKKLVWGDAMGKRTFSLTSMDNGTMFSMTEKIAAPLFPLFSRMIPPFDETFERFVKELEEEVLNQKSGK